MIYYVSPEGSDTNPGTEARPFKTTAKAGNTANAGDTIVLAPGNYDALTSHPGLNWRGAGPRTRVSDDEGFGRDSRATGITFANGLSLGYQRTRFSFCRIEGPLTITGGRAAAATDIVFFACDFDSPAFWWHAYGADRDTTVPHISGIRFHRCNITIRRRAGHAGVLWRASSCDHVVLERCNIRLVQPDAVGGNDDSASVKRLWCQNWRMSDNVWMFENPAGFEPFWMDRDDTSFTVYERDIFVAEKGGIWFSPNTAGTWVCTCKGSVFRNCLWRVKDLMRFYQCKRDASDEFRDCEIRAGRFDPNNVGTMPPGLVVKPYDAP